jgi:hypothetical protein
MRLLPSYFAIMKNRWKAIIAAIVFLAGLLNAGADEHRTTGAHSTRSGIAGQVLDILSSQDPNGGMFYSVEPVPVTLWIEVKRGHHWDRIKTVDTAPDGTFSVDVPPGEYFIEPDPASGYLLGGVIGLYTDTLDITVHPRKITYDEIYIMSGYNPVFPG